MDQATSQSQELSNSEVHFTIHKKPACRVEFDVQASKELVAAALSKAIKLIAKEITLPGFRKGKAPDAMILKNYPKDVDKKWQEHIADLAFRACEKLAKVPLLNREAKISFNMKKHSNDGAHLILSFETEPEIPTIDPKTFQPKEIAKPEVNEEKIQETLRQVRFFFAQWTPVKDRGVQEGDFVILDVDVIEKDPAEPLFSHTRFEVAPQYMAQWMKDLVIGKNVNDKAEGLSTPDADIKPEEKEVFKEQKVRITIKAIEEATLPEITEDFLKNLGVNTAEEMHASIERLLHKQSSEHVKEKLHEQVNEYLLEQYPFDLPVSFIEKETQFRMRQLSQDPNFQKYWQSLSTEERKKMLDSIYYQSEKAVRMFYMCRKIIADAKITISPQDLPQPATTPLEMLLDPDQMLHYHEQSEIKQAEALSRLVLEKAADYIVTHAQQA